MAKKGQNQIFIAFFRAGMLGYGGGPSSIPLIHKEVVEKYKWMNDQQFSELLATGNALPGPIATKLAGYIGYRLAEIAGCLIGLTAMVMPTAIMMIVLLGVFHTYKDAPQFKGITHAVAPVISVMLATLGYSFLKKAWKGTDKFTIILISAVSVIALVFLHLHPAILILGCILFAFLPSKQKKMNQRKVEAK